MNRILFILFTILTISNSQGQVIFHVSKNGNDSNIGSIEFPLASLTGAKNAIQEYKDSINTDIGFTVLVDDGTYFMDRIFALYPKDSGSKKSLITYKAKNNGKAIFSAGRKISGFTVNDNGIWETEIIGNVIDFNQLYINNKMGVLARTPNDNNFTIKKVEENIIELGSGRIPLKATQTITLYDNALANLRNLTKEDLESIRVRIFHNWNFTLRYIDKVNTNNNSIKVSGAGMPPWNKYHNNQELFLENYLGALDSPGEWFFDKKKSKLYYYPKEGETPENTEIIIPVLQNIIQIKGDASVNKLVKNITFEGLVFKHSNYIIPNSGIEPAQASIHAGSAIAIEGGENINFNNCEVTNIAQHAFWFNKGSNNSKVENCYIHNIGGGGIYIGDTKISENISHTKNILVSNNIIKSGGREFPSAIGVWIGHSSDNNIIHNDIADFYYTGISVGWVWGYKESVAKRNKISFNNIHHIGWTLLSDMSGIYTLGKSEGTVINNNVIHHIHSFSYGGWGLYTDEGSSGILLENNLVYNTKTGGFHQHYGGNNIIRNNIFAFAKMYQLQCTKVEDHLSFTFTNNIVVFNQGVLLEGSWRKIDIKMDHNLYWNTNSEKFKFNKKSFRKWKRKYHDSNSIIANPNFEDISNFNFTIKSEVNTKKIDFKPFDYTKAGVLGSEEWIEKSKLSESIIEEFDVKVNFNINKN